MDLKGKIIADAVRLLKWGKPWHELAELIARIAERPSAVEIRKVLRTHKTRDREGRPAPDNPWKFQAKKRPDTFDSDPANRGFGS